MLPPQIAALYGDLNLYEWPVVTVLMHEWDHQAQIRRLLDRLRVVQWSTIGVSSQSSRQPTQPERQEKKGGAGKRQAAVNLSEGIEPAVNSQHGGAP